MENSKKCDDACCLRRLPINIFNHYLFPPGIHSSIRCIIFWSCFKDKKRNGCFLLSQPANFSKAKSKRNLERQMNQRSISTCSCYFDARSIKWWGKVFHSSAQQSLSMNSIHPSTVLGKEMMTHSVIGFLLLLVSGRQIFFKDMQTARLQTLHKVSIIIFSHLRSGDWGCLRRRWLVFSRAGGRATTNHLLIFIYLSRIIFSS